MRFLLLLLFSALMISCASGNFNEVVRTQAITQPNVDEATYRLRGTRSFNQETVAIFSANDAMNPPGKLLGFVLLEQGILNWKTGTAGIMGRDAVKPGSKRFDYTVSDFFDVHARVPDPNSQYILIWGELFSVDVAMVQVILSDGSVLKDSGSGMVFAFLLTKPNVACQIRLLGHANELLEAVDLTDNCPSAGAAYTVVVKGNSQISTGD